MKRLIIHVGQPKTGSTSLQYFLAANRLALARAGIAYPSGHGSVLPPLNRATYHLSAALARAGLSRLPEALKWESNHTNLSYQVGYSRNSGSLFSASRMTFEKLHRFVETCTEDTVILSSESMLQFRRLEDRMRTLDAALSGIIAGIEVVAFLRANHTWINSHFAQLTRQLDNTLTFPEFCERHLERRPHSPADTILKWLELPNVRLVCLPFTASRLKPDLATAFFTGLGLQDRTSALPGARDTFANETLGPNTIEACRRTALVLSGLKHEPLSRARRRVVSRKLIAACSRQGWNRVKYNGLDNTWRDRIANCYRAENDRAAVRFWNSAWIEVFADDYDQDFQPNDPNMTGYGPGEERAINDIVRQVLTSSGINVPNTIRP